MTDLERRALLGDLAAQNECTERGIVLPCAHGAECRVFEIKVEDKTAYRVISMKCCCFQGPARLTKKDAISDWNMRPAPMIRWCDECAFRNTFDCPCSKNGFTLSGVKFCGWFEPKEEVK